MFNNFIYIILGGVFLLTFFYALGSILWQEDPVLTVFAVVVAGVWTYIEETSK